MNIPALVLLFIMLQALDVQLTEVGLMLPGLYEINPIIRSIGWEIAYIYKVIYVTFSSALLLFASALHPVKDIKRVVKCVAWIITIISALPVLWNFLMIQLHL